MYLVYFPDSSSIRRYRCLRFFNETYYKVETHDDEHVNDDEDEFIVCNTKVELIPADTSVITTEPVHDEADDLPASVVVPEDVEPVVCEVDPQQNDVKLTVVKKYGTRRGRSCSQTNVKLLVALAADKT